MGHHTMMGGKKMNKKFIVIIVMLITGYCKAADKSVHRFGIPHDLPDTGQTGTWDVNGNPGGPFGQDADYQPAGTQMSYTDNGDGTITDNRTGLMWLKDANNYNGGATQTWEAALNGREGFT